MAAAELAFASGQHAITSHTEAVQQSLELHAAGIFRRQQFLEGLQSTYQQLPPYRTVHMVQQCLVTGLLGWEVLQALCPDPQKACQLIQEACCSYEAIQQPQLATTDQSNSRVRPHAAPVTIQLLQQLILHVLGWDSSDTSSSTSDGNSLALHDYLQQLLQHVQYSCHNNQALAVCLFEAAARCAATFDAPVLARWTKQQLQALLSEHPSNHTQAPSIVNQAWAAAFLLHDSWHCIMPVAAQLLGLQELLQELRQHVTAAVTSKKALNRMVDVLGALMSWSNEAQQAAQQMLSSVLSAALRQGHLQDLLAVMLLAQNLLSVCEYTKMMQAATSEVFAADAPSGSWPVLLRALNLMLCGASLPVLQAHVKLLQAILPFAGSAAQQKVKDTLDMLRSAASEKQQEDKRQQTASDKASIKMTCSIRSDLAQFTAQPVINGRRQFSEYQRTRWRMFKTTVPEWALALATNPPETATDARVRWEFLKALEDLNLGTHNGVNYSAVIQSAIGQLMRTCAAVGVDMSGRTEQPTAGPLQEMQQMLERLPGAAANACQQPLALRTLLARISQTMEQTIHPQPNPERTAAATITGGLPAKRQRIELTDVAPTVAGVGQAQSANASNSHEQRQNVVLLLLKAYSSVSRQLNGPGNLSWRLEFVELLQQHKELHGVLFQHLLWSVHGRHKDVGAEEAVARSMAHAQLLVVLTAAQPADLLLLQPGSQDQLKQVETAIPLHAWQMHSAAQSANWQCSSYSKDGSNAELHENTGTVGKAISGRWQSQLRHHFDGFKLLDWLISCTSLENDRNLCFAAIFWAAYVIGVGGLGSWCAGSNGPFRWASSAATQQASMMQQQQHRVLGYLPPQLLALLRALHVRLGTLALSDQCSSDTGTHDTAILIEKSHQVLSTVLANGKPLKWLEQSAEPRYQCSG